MESKNIIGVLRIMDDLKIKPNYSELSRVYDTIRAEVFQNEKKLFEYPNGINIYITKKLREMREITNS